MIKVKIEKEVAEGLFQALGTASLLNQDKQRVELSADVLVQQTGKGKGLKAELILDGSKHISKINGKEVLAYSGEDLSTGIKSKLQPGDELEFSKFAISLKN